MSASDRHDALLGRLLADKAAGASGVRQSIGQQLSKEELRLRLQQRTRRVSLDVPECVLDIPKAAEPEERHEVTRVSLDARGKGLEDEEVAR